MRRTFIPHAALCCLILSSVAACQHPSARNGSPSSPWALASPLVPLPAPPRGVNAHWESLPFRLTPAKVRLGRWLFFDRRLSADATISCATCHRPDHAFSETAPTATGIRGQVGSRKAPPILNIAWPMYTSFFWDGRASSIVEQAKAPISNPIEMGNTHERAVATVGSIAGYREAFSDAFGDGPVDIDRVAEAIAAYEATRFSGDAPFDRYQAGDVEALSPLARIGAFKTPTLRDLTKRSPYMHDGSIGTLREVAQYYAQRGSANPWLAPEMRGVVVTSDDVDALVAFLESLDGTGYEDAGPTLFPL
jgi:cytochrome c peroxidase